MNAEHYYLVIKDEQAGPYTLDEIHRMLDERTITPQTLCAQQDGLEWIPVADLSHIFSTRSQRSKLASPALILMGVIVVVVGIILAQHIDPGEQTDAQRARTAYPIAEKLVRDQLKAPSTAKFLRNETDFLRDENGALWVRIVVDAQNTFAAMMRSRYWVCVHEGSSDGWVATKVAEEDSKEAPQRHRDSFAEQVQKAVEKR